VARVQGFAVGGIAVVEDIGLIRFFVEVNGWVNPSHLRKFNWIAPRPSGVSGCYDKIAVVVNVGAGNVVSTLMIANGGGKKPPGHPLTHEIHLFGPVDDIADLLPVFQILTVEYRNAREVGKGRINQVIIGSNPNNTRIGVKPG
jgi:hypothetical protein